jgi:hypothetical protein
VSFVDPAATQDPAVNLVAIDTWGDAVNTYQNDLRGAKAGCLLSTVAATVAGTKTIIPFASESYDVQACHSTVSNTSRITIPTGWGGLWMIGANLRYTNNVFTLYFVLNGDTTNGLIWAKSSNAWTAGDTSRVSVDTIYRFTAGDYVEIALDGTGAGSVFTGDNSYFWAQFLHG